MDSPVLFLDDASVGYSVVSEGEALEIASSLVHTLRSLYKIKSNLALNSHISLGKFEITPGRTLSSVIGGDKYRDEWNFIKTLANRSPLSCGIDPELAEEIQSLELKTKSNDIQSIALGWAYLLDTAVVSCPGHVDWSTPWVDVECQEVDCDGELFSKTASIKNIGTIEHASEHSLWLKSFGAVELEGASCIWNKRDVRFPRLRFLGRVEEDLRNLESAGAPFSQALNALDVLNEDATLWESVKCGWPEFTRKTSPESSTRRNLCWFADELDKSSKCFAWHTRFTGSIAGRIHFIVDHSSWKFVVAYIGAKL